MSKSVPHFSEEWLNQYNQRLLDMASKAGNTEQPGKRQGRAEAPANTHARAKMSPHSPTKRAAVPFRAYSGKQTKTEQLYNQTVLHGRGRFEAVCLYLPGGGRYTPDFMTIDDGRVTFHEVKGSYRLQSQGRALTAFQEAAAAFPCFAFVWAKKLDNGNFDIMRIETAAIDEGNVE